MQQHRDVILAETTDVAVPHPPHHHVVVVAAAVRVVVAAGHRHQSN